MEHLEHGRNSCVHNGATMTFCRDDLYHNDLCYEEVIHKKQCRRCGESSPSPPLPLLPTHPRKRDWFFYHPACLLEGPCCFRESCCKDTCSATCSTTCSRAHVWEEHVVTSWARSWARRACWRWRKRSSGHLCREGRDITCHNSSVRFMSGEGGKGGECSRVWWCHKRRGTVSQCHWSS